LEIVATSGTTLSELVENLLSEVGPAFYQRTDLRLSHPVSKAAMSHVLVEEAPVEIGGEKVSGISTIDGVKYLIADGSWLLIRPSGTEPVLRVYAEGRTPKMVQALLGYGEQVAIKVA
jgi:phosphomannomutase